jgi:monovalent cation/hydrogen antiporter
MAVPARVRGLGRGRLATGWLVVQVGNRLDDPLLGNLVTILTPLTAFLLAEVIGRQ